MKRSIGPAAVFFLSLCGFGRAEDAPATNQRSIKVTGTGQVRVKPDRATVTFGVRAFEKELTDAKKQHDTRMAKLLECIKEAGIAETDYQTTYVNASPIFEKRDYSSKRDVVLGYEATSGVYVVVKDLKILSALVANAVAAGASRIESVSFASSDAAKQKDEALRRAVAAARTRADIVAGELGQKAGKAVAVIAQAGEPVDYDDDQSGLGGGRFMGGGQSTTIEVFAVGEIVISTTVQATFELE